MPIRVAIPGFVNAYTAACYRALAARGDVEPLVIAKSAKDKSAKYPFAERIYEGVPLEPLAPDRFEDIEHIAGIIADFGADVVMLPGWNRRSRRALAFHPRLRGMRFIMSMDTPFDDTLRQRLGRYRYGRFFSRLDLVVTPGERGAVLARVLGFPESKIRKGTYGFDYESLATRLEARRSREDGWPRRFLTVGRLAPEKGLDLLLAANRMYRERVDDPWPLTLCGTGPLEAMVREHPVVDYRGFVQPSDLANVYEESGVFLLTSLFEPWAVVIMEACAAGLPVGCTTRCGASVELIRDRYNGVTFPPGNAKAIADAMEYFHRRYDDLSEMGQRAQEFARPYAADEWAANHQAWFTEICNSDR